MASPVAIIGISAEFPSGTGHKENLNHEAFFDFLLNKGQAYEQMPSERFNIESWKGPHSGQVITDTGSFLKNVSLFDHLEFGINATDARNMSLSTRKLIEHSFLALLDSSIDYRGRNVGCFTTGVSFDMTTLTEPDEMDARGSFAGYSYMIANKVSYHLDLRGPSVPTDTACSSSLTALHLAVQSIRSGDCEAAVVGGCQLNYRLIDFIQYSQGGILSPDGKCKPFDSSADGFGRGEGVCVLVIKSLKDAIRDGDSIYASILGTGINSSGGVAPVSAPVATAQEDAMRKAYMNSGRLPSEVDFIELHATGTAVGDPTEANWVGNSFKREDGGELLIGSVKGNIGHLEITAFLASMSKVCSILRTGLVPPNVNLTHLNPAIQWEKYHLRVPTEITKIKPRSPSGKLLVSMTSSGIGGTNGHVVLESPPQQVVVAHIDNNVTNPILVCIGGLSPRSASQVATDVQELISKGELSEDTATIYARRCRQMTWRTFAVFYPRQLSRPPSFPEPILVPRSRPPMVFVFSGQGPQHFNMGRDLYRSYPVFKESVLQLDAIHTGITGYSLVQDIGLFEDSEATLSLPDIWPISITIPALCMLQIALYELIKSFGLQADAVIGHSAGEAAMFYASGATNRELAMEISIARGMAMTHLESEDGAMAAVNCTIEDANSIRDEICLNKAKSDVLDIGCYNSSSAFVFSGSRSLVEKAVELGKLRGLFARLIRTRIPVHSGLMELCRRKYEELVTEAFDRHSSLSHSSHPSIPTYSCLDGKRWSRPFTPDYIWSTARNPVLFSQSIGSVLQDMPTACFLELSPHPVLTSYISDLVGSGDNTVLASLKRAKESDAESVEIFTLLSTLGKVSTLGYNITGFHRNTQDSTIHLPEYPFSKKEVEYLSRSSRVHARQLAAKNPLYDPSGELRLNSLSHADIAQHVIRGEAIMPAAGYIEMAFESGACEVWDIQFKSIMPFPRDNYLLVTFSSSGPYWEVISRRSDQHLTTNPKAHRKHAEGFISTKSPLDPNVKTFSPLKVMGRCRKINVNEFYANLQYFAGYGPMFQRVQACYLNDIEALVEVKACADDIPNFHRYIIHPAILDSCFHIMVSPSFTGNSDRFGYYLPSGVRSVTLYRPDFFTEMRPGVIYSYVKLLLWEPDHIDYDLYLLDIDGTIVCEMQGFRVSWHDMEQTHQPHRKSYDMAHIPSEINVNVYLDEKTPNFDSENRSSDLRIITFEPNDIADLQRAITELKRSDSRRLWIQATIGLEGSSAEGLFRSLSREVTGKEFILVLFHSKWEEKDRRSIINGLSKRSEIEHEILVDANGIIKYPRIVPSAIQADNSQVLTPNDLWQWNNEKNMIRISFPSDSGDILVRFEAVTSTSAGGLRGFVGTVIQSGNDRITSGNTVAGITSSDVLTNHAVIPDGHFIPISEATASLCDYILPALITRLATGIGFLKYSTHRNRSRIIYVTADDVIDNLILHLLDSLGVTYSVIHRTRLQPISLVSGPGCVLVSSITNGNEIKVIQRLSRGKIPTFFFNDEFAGLQRMVNTDPWSVSETLEAITPLLPTVSKYEEISVDPKTLLPNRSATVYRDLFEDNKTYLLVGGIGSLGLQVALWMYQNGARHLILTSRRGRSSLNDPKDIMAQRIVEYLTSRPELNIRLEACDATSETQVGRLIEEIQAPIAGCLLMSVVLSDRLFMSHTEETYNVPFASKLGAFEVLSRSVDVKALDFVVSFSSAATFGNPGQTNYASANTQLEGVLSSYTNAFSLVCPAILDTITISHGDALRPDTRYRNWIPWAMSSKQLCECLGDGIRKLAIKPFTHYIPDLVWNHVQRHFGKSPLYASLVPVTEETTVKSASESKSLNDIIAKHLDMDVTDLASNVPLTSYGLDSLSAGRLAYALKPMATVTQLQLLGDMTLQDLGKLAEQSSSNDDDDLSPALKRGFDWVDLSRPGETIVKLVEGEENPLILIHGGTGAIVAFIPLQERFKTALWAIQSTPDAPRESITDTASHYCAKIKEERPSGPYRIAGYCASSLLAFEIVRILEQNGDRISQFVILDHFPSVFVSPLFPLDDESLETGNPSNALLEEAFFSLYNCYYRDPAHGRKKLATELLDAHRGSKGRPFIEYTYQYFQDIVAACLRFLLEIGGPDLRYNASNAHLLRDKLKAWISEISAPITVVVASRGIGAELITDPEWLAFGAKDFLPNAEVVEIPYGHFDMFENEELVQLLERDLADVVSL